MWTMNFQLFKLDLAKAEEPEIKWPTFAGSQRKQENSRKTSTSALLIMPKPLTAWITNKDLLYSIGNCSMLCGSLDERGVWGRIPKKDNAKECSNYHTVALISHTSKVMLKILQARWLPDVQAGFRKAEEPEIKLPTSTGSLKKQGSSRKTSIYALLTMPKPLTMWITINCGRFWKRWEYQTTWPASWETYMQVRKQQLELDVEQQTGSK